MTAQKAKTNMIVNRIHLRITWMALVVFGATGCHESDQQASTAASAVSKTSGQLHLDESRRKELGIEISRVKTQTAQATLTRVGWLMVPPAGETIVRAPIAGFVVSTPKKDWPKLGQAVASGQALAQLNVFLTPQEVSLLVQTKEDNDIQIQQSLVTMQISESQLKLLSAARDAVTGVRVDQLKEAYERSKAAYKEAQQKAPFLIPEPDENGVVVKPVGIEIPKAGRILQMHAAPGQFVQTGDPLWTVADWSTLWLRVSVFEGDAQRIDPSKPAQIRDRKSGAVTTAAVITVPTEMKPGTRTIDFHYTVENQDWTLRSGQSMAVELPTAGKQQVLTIPISAVLYDGFGQTYCYSAEADHTQFQRRRIELGTRHEKSVIVSRGLDASDAVVSVGAEQLAAEESKGELAVEDSD